MRGCRTPSQQGLAVCLPEFRDLRTALFNIMNTDRQEKGYKKLLVGKAWEYLYENFHKFNDTNKIKVALELCKKDLPTKMEGELTTKVVMDKVEKDGKPLEHKVGNA